MTFEMFFKIKVSITIFFWWYLGFGHSYWHISMSLEELVYAFSSIFFPYSKLPPSTPSPAPAPTQCLP